MTAVYNAAANSGVMAAEDIKVRALPYNRFLLHQGEQQFVHVNCRLLAGRSPEQKLVLSEDIREALAELLPEVYSISVEVIDMDPASYRKRVLALRYPA